MHQFVHQIIKNLNVFLDEISNNLKIFLEEKSYSKIRLNIFFDSMKQYNAINFDKKKMFKHICCKKLF